MGERRRGWDRVVEANLNRMNATDSEATACCLSIFFFIYTSHCVNASVWFFLSIWSVWMSVCVVVKKIPCWMFSFLFYLYFIYNAFLCVCLLFQCICSFFYHLTYLFSLYFSYSKSYLRKFAYVLVKMFKYESITIGFTLKRGYSIQNEKERLIGSGRACFSTLCYSYLVLSFFYLIFLLLF